MQVTVSLLPTEWEILISNTPSSSCLYSLSSSLPAANSSIESRVRRRRAGDRTIPYQGVLYTVPTATADTVASTLFLVVPLQPPFPPRPPVEHIEATLDFYDRYLLIEGIGNCGRRLTIQEAVFCNSTDGDLFRQSFRGGEGEGELSLPTIL